MKPTHRELTLDEKRACHVARAKKTEVRVCCRTATTWAGGAREAGKTYGVPVDLAEILLARDLAQLAGGPEAPAVETAAQELEGEMADARPARSKAMKTGKP